MSKLEIEVFTNIEDKMYVMVDCDVTSEFWLFDDGGCVLEWNAYDETLPPMPDLTRKVKISIDDWQPWVWRLIRRILPANARMYWLDGDGEEHWIRRRKEYTDPQP